MGHDSRLFDVYDDNLLYICIHSIVIFINCLPIELFLLTVYNQRIWWFNCYLKRGIDGILPNESAYFSGGP